MLKPSYVMVGGFLGAGKTTALLQLAARYTAQGLRVGLITNDQSVGLVDTAMSRSQGFPTEEITGGCFCCRFGSLREAAQKLTAETRPDVFLAEPVGSCTDLVATVVFPLRKLYGSEFSVAPLTVLVDPIRAQRLLGLRQGKAFSPKVTYIYDRQLEEADFIAINKTDLLSAPELDALEAALRDRYPEADVLRISARDGIGLKEWMARLADGAGRGGDAMAVDYDMYAEGEALLGWVNVTARLTSANAFDGNAFLRELVRSMGQRLATRESEVAHLKATMQPNFGADLAVANLVRGDGSVDVPYQLAEELDTGDLLINLRAEGDPATSIEDARDVLRQTAESVGVTATVTQAEAFRPGRPTPTHRLDRLEAASG